MNYHVGPYYQRGRGIGNILGKLFRSAVPIISSIGKSIVTSPITKNLVTAGKKAAIDTGLNVVTDVIEGRNVGESIRENVGQARQRLAQNLRESRAKRAPKRKAAPKKTKRKKYPKRSNLFS